MRAVAVAASLVLIAACSPAVPPYAQAPEPRQGAAEWDDVEPDSAIETRAGQEFTVTLRANATTGYGWALADSLDPALLLHVRNDYVADPAPRGMAGSGGRERWTFRALAPGEATIFMRYARAWEGSSSAATAVFRVIIRP